MTTAFHELFGIKDAFDGIEMAGRTDKWILDAAASRAGVDLSGGNFERFRDRYFVRLVETLDGHDPVRPDPGRGPSGVLPGVRDLLSTIEARTDVFPALLTGNCEEGARIKLEHFDLWKFFRCGAYGDRVADRSLLVDVALQRAQACGVSPRRRSDVVVIGDTVLDVACAKAAGARCVAVATGSAEMDVLVQAGADLVMPDLGDTHAVVRFISVQT